ncbi:molecular chaperone GrpE [methanogenic archaeon mixed culture ISO4-G1]|nr:molecular chaperone GrpE [methanogenic archaeon mixed culture ISO4-G1]
MSDNKFMSFLGGLKSSDKQEEPAVQEEPTVSIEVPDENVNVTADEPVSAVSDEMEDTILALKAQIEELKLTIQGLRENPPFPDMSAFVTSREQIKSLTNAIERQNIEITNRSLTSCMEQIAVMREDFFKLCEGMRKKIDSMSAKDVLSSFEAYEVDMENILSDGGVFIGHFPYDSLNTIHQRIVEVIPTNDQSKNGLIAERLSDGYKLGDRVLLKEKVSVYKYTEEALKPVTEETEAPAEETPAVEPVQTHSKKKKKTKKSKKSEAEE